MDVVGKYLDFSLQKAKMVRKNISEGENEVRGYLQVSDNDPKGY